MASGSPGDLEATSALMTGARQRRLRRFWRSLPHAPRCKLCHRPFAGIGGGAMRLIGLGPWPGNPAYCRACFRSLYRTRAGAEIECTLLFADVRDSTVMAESMRPAAFRALMDRFYETAFDVLVAHDAIVDKFAGDEVIGIFVPALTDARHARLALDAGLELLRATGHDGPSPWVPVGIGINSGIAYVGAVGTEEHVEFTALGDTVNVASRLSSAAGTGEILAARSTMHEAHWTDDDLESRDLQLKGKSESTDAAVITLRSATGPTVQRGGT